MPAQKKAAAKKKAAKTTNQYRIVYSKKSESTRNQKWVNCPSAKDAWETLSKDEQYTLVEINYLGPINE